MRITALAFALIWAAPTASAQDCQDVSDFDQTEPKKEGEQIDNTYAKFNWASDVDVIEGRSKLWNYIYNDDEKNGWNGDWAKGGINQPLIRPLAPKTYACAKKALWKHKDDPESAPIIYAPSNQAADALVFVKAEKEAADQQAQTATQATSETLGTSLEIGTTYLDAKQQPATATFFLGAIPKGDFTNFYFKPSSGVIVAISKIKSNFPQTAIQEIFAAAKNQGRELEFVALGDWAAKDSLSGIEAVDPKEQFLIVHNEFGAEIKSVPDPDAPEVTAQVVMFDETRVPILVTTVDLPAMK
jgi:hypothetical protein